MRGEVYKIAVEPIFIERRHLEAISPGEIGNVVIIFPGIVDADVGISLVGQGPIAQLITSHFGNIQNRSVLAHDRRGPLKRNRPINNPGP